MEYRYKMPSILKFSALLTLLLVAGRTFGVPAAELKENYQSIIDRNPFGLKPPPPPPTNNAALVPKEEKPKTEIFLTGITSIGYPRFPKQVYLMTKTLEKGKKEESSYYALTEGVEKDGIKILEIDAVGRKVKIMMENEEKLLSFQTDGVPPPAATGGKPGAPGQPGAPGVPQPGGVPIPLPIHQAGAPQSNVTPGIQPISQNNGISVVPNATATYRQIPPRRIRGGNNNGVSTPYNGSPNSAPVNGNLNPQQPEIDPAEQYLRMHLDKAAKERQGIPMPPLPPAM